MHTIATGELHTKVGILRCPAESQFSTESTDNGEMDSEYSLIRLVECQGRDGCLDVLSGLTVYRGLRLLLILSVCSTTPKYILAFSLSENSVYKPLCIHTSNDWKQ